MSTELVEPELRRHRECGLGETSSFLVLACDLSDPSRERQDTCRRGRDRVAGESLRAREMLADEIVLAPLPEDLREERLGLGCALRVAHRQQCVSCGLECILLARRVVGPVERDGKPKQKVGALVVIRPERERVVVLGRRDRVAVEGGRSVSGCAQGQASALHDLVVATT